MRPAQAVTSDVPTSGSTPAELTRAHTHRAPPAEARSSASRVRLMSCSRTCMCSRRASAHHAARSASCACSASCSCAAGAPYASASVRLTRSFSSPPRSISHRSILPRPSSTSPRRCSPRSTKVAQHSSPASRRPAII
eukprot:scaffold7427_cov101-Isochrysis_galbana.AAC.2